VSGSRAAGFVPSGLQPSGSPLASARAEKEAEPRGLQWLTDGAPAVGFGCHV